MPRSAEHTTSARPGSAATSFFNAAFSGDTTFFGEATFSGEQQVRRRQVQRRAPTSARARFSGDRTYFGGATFSGDSTDFVAATFSGKFASFENPRAWNNVTFDWDEELTNMPECIRPRDWPPMIVPEDE